ncbi:MAG: PKD domain-containing protein [Bacteroidia bacterium]
MKKNLLTHLIVLIFAFTGMTKGFAQCANDNVLVAGNLTPPGPTLSTTQSYGAGQYMLANVIAGANYTVSLCSNSSFDTQVTVYEDLTGTFVAYNDDFCGLRSQVSFTPTFCGDVRVLIDQYSCNNTGFSSIDVVMTMNTAGAGVPMLTAAPDQQACSGGNVTIGLPNNGSGGIPPYTFGWNPIVNLTTPTQTQTGVLNVTATQNYALTLTDQNGCKAIDTVLVTVLPAPTVFLGNDTTICGGPIILDAGNIGSGYLWSTGAGTQMLPVSSTGAYSVAVQNTFGCIGTDAINIVVNPNPTVSIGPDTASCSPSVTLTAASGFASYDWTTGDTTTMTTVTATGPVAITITDSNGCTATDTANVTLSPTPVVNLGPDSVRCGGVVVLNAQNPGSLYFWSNNTSAQTTNATTTGPYIVQVITPQGCTNSDTVNITINAVPNVNLGPDTSLCGNTILLNAGNPGASYLWNNSATTQTRVVGSGTHYVRVTNAAGCAASDTITVTTNVTPSISAGSNVTICAGASTTLTATGGLTYVWSNGANTSNTTVNPTINTVYYVTGYDANGCASSSTVSVVVIPLENAAFTSSVVGATGVFMNQSTNAVSYSWNFGDASPGSTSANPVHTYATNGTFVVTLTVTGPCGSSTSTATVVITQVGLQDNDLSQTLSLFPNPNDGNFTLAFDFTKSKDVTIQVLDMSGRIIYTDMENDIMSYNKQIGLEAAESGMYFVRIITTEGVVTEKVMIQR